MTQQSGDYHSASGQRLGVEIQVLGDEAKRHCDPEDLEGLLHKTAISDCKSSCRRPCYCSLYV